MCGPGHRCNWIDFVLKGMTLEVFLKEDYFKITSHMFGNEFGRGSRIRIYEGIWIERFCSFEVETNPSRESENPRTSITFFFSISLSTATDKSLVCSLQQSADWGFESQFPSLINPDNFPQTSSPISVLNGILISPIYCRVWRVQQTLACPKQLSTLDEPPVSNFVLKTHPALFCAWDGGFREEDLFLFSILDST